MTKCSMGGNEKFNSKDEKLSPKNGNEFIAHFW